MSGDFRIGLMQLGVSESKKENFNRVVSAIERSETSDLLVFPEYCMRYPSDGLSRQYLEDLAEPLNGELRKQDCRVK